MAWQQVTGMETSRKLQYDIFNSGRAAPTSTQEDPAKDPQWVFLELVMPHSLNMSPNLHLNILELIIILIEFELFVGNFMFRNLLLLTLFVTSMFI